MIEVTGPDDVEGYSKIPCLKSDGKSVRLLQQAADWNDVRHGLAYTPNALKRVALL